MRLSRRWLIGLVMVAVVVVVAVAFAVVRGGEAEHEGKGDPDRDVSGARIAAAHERTVRTVLTTAAPAAAGFDSERLWSTGSRPLQSISARRVFIS
jgi:hypothetical protein